MNTYNIFHRFFNADEDCDLKNYDYIVNWFAATVQFCYKDNALRRHTYANIGTERVFAEWFPVSKGQIYILRLTADPLRPKPKDLLWSLTFFLSRTKFGSQASITIVNPDYQAYALTTETFFTSALTGDFFPYRSISSAETQIWKGLGASTHFKPQVDLPAVYKPCLFEAHHRAIDNILSDKPIALAMFAKTEKINPPWPLVPVKAYRHWAPADFDFENFTHPPKLNDSWQYQIPIKQSRDFLAQYVNIQSRGRAKLALKMKHANEPESQPLENLLDQIRVAVELTPLAKVDKKPLAKIQSKYKAKSDIPTPTMPLEAPVPTQTKPVIKVNSEALWQAREDAKALEAFEAEAKLTREEKALRDLEKVQAEIKLQADDIALLKSNLKLETQRRQSAERKAQHLLAAVSTVQSPANHANGEWYLRLMTDETLSITVLDALTLLKELSPNVIILPSAEASAQKVSKHSVVGRRLLKLLVRLTYDWRNLYRDKGDTSARQVFTPSEYSAQESDTTTKGALMQQREFIYQGQKITMKKHLKIGVLNDIRFTLRVYFEYDREIDKIIIGYCGEHLNLNSVS